MKKLLYSLLTLAAALTVTSCLKEVEGGSAAYDDGTLVDATFSVTLGPQTKAFADGTQVDKLYAGIYEIASPTATSYTHVAHGEGTLSDKNGSVSFTGKISRGKYYKVVFWAQKEGAPYDIDWAENATTGPIVTVTETGDANDEDRDAFYGEYKTLEAVTGNIELTSPVSLKRPFAQVNVLVPKANFNDPTAAITSSMTVYQAPTKLNLASKETSVPKEWSFASKAISEAAFGDYDNNYKYVAMNYVLVDQAAAGAQYDVTFSVTSGSQVATDKQVKKAPLKPNGRTNIVGNIFAEDFDITVPVVIGPAPGTDEVVTTVTVNVGNDENNPATISGATNIAIGLPYTLAEEDGAIGISYDRDDVVIAAWDYDNQCLVVTPKEGVTNGSAVITLVFPAVTKTSYTAATVKIYVKVGNGQNEELEPVATPTFDPAEGAVASGTAITIATTTPDATIYYTMGENPADPTTSSTPYDPDDKPKVTAATTIKAIAVKEGMENSEIAEATYTIDAESVVYSLSPEATGANTSPHNSYTAAATTTISEIEWSVMGNSNMVPWRIGGKSIKDENREIFSLNPISENVSKIVVTHGEASSITVNSVTLVVASDSSFETVVSEISKNDFAASSTMTFNRPAGKSWANCYYKFVYNVTVDDTKNNRFVQFIGAEFTGK